MNFANKIVSAPMGAVSNARGGTAYLCHAVELDADGSPARVLCGKAKAEHILDDYSLFDVNPVDCPVCLRKWKR